jgi:acyl carrier protein
MRMGEPSDVTEPTELERRLVDEVVTPHLGAVPERVDQSLIDLGATSAQLLEMLAETEKLFDVELSAMELMDDASVAGLAAMLERQHISAGH